MFDHPVAANLPYVDDLYGELPPAAANHVGNLYRGIYPPIKPVVAPPMQAPIDLPALMAPIPPDDLPFEDFDLLAPVVALLNDPDDPMTLEEIIIAFGGMFEPDETRRPSPEKRKARRVYAAFFPVKHQFKEDLDEAAIAASDQMNRGADLSAQEMLKGFCVVCQDKFWPSDEVDQVEEPDQIVRIMCNCLFHRVCLTRSPLDANCCPICHCQAEKGYQQARIKPLTWNGADHPPAPAAEDPAPAEEDPAAAAGGAELQDGAWGGAPAPAQVATAQFAADQARVMKLLASSSSEDEDEIAVALQEMGEA